MGIAGTHSPHVVAAGDQRFFVITAARTGSTLLSAILGDAMDQIYAAIEALKGKVIPPSSQARRSWNARRGRHTQRGAMGSYAAQPFERPRITGDAEA